MSTNLDPQTSPDRRAIARNKARLNAAFRDLRKQGILARQDYTCCQTCGQAALLAEAHALADRGKWVRGGVFYHGQDTDHLRDDGCCYLAFAGYDAEDASDAALAEAAIRVALAAVDTLRRHGVRTEWEGVVGRRIMVDLTRPSED